MTRTKNWKCDSCGELAVIASPRCFSTTHYGSACENCTGVGVIFKPQPDKLIVHPEKPLCSGAMYSPGYWPETYLCKDTGIIQALAERYHFDSHETPWSEMSLEAQEAFLHGDDHPMVILIIMDVGGAPTYRCSGTLISPTVVLTAGHCTSNYPDAEFTGLRIFTESDVQNGDNTYPWRDGPNSIEAAATPQMLG